MISASLRCRGHRELVSPSYYPSHDPLVPESYDFSCACAGLCWVTLPCPDQSRDWEDTGSVSCAVMVFCVNMVNVAQREGP